jgi:hypothetical protein
MSNSEYKFYPQDQSLSRLSVFTIMTRNEREMFVPVARAFVLVVTVILTSSLTPLGALT